MLLSDFDYPLPPELIAQHPLADRAAARLLHLKRADGRLCDRRFTEFSELLRADDLLVLNDTRVFPARLYGRRAGLRAQPVSRRNPAARDFLRGRIEVLLTRRIGEWEWEALVRPGRKIGVGERLSFAGGGRLEAEVTWRGEFGERRLRFSPLADFFAALEGSGHVPLPPYIDRPDQPEDRERYQTVYARETGSVAAPTAGLHFTPEVLAQLARRGIEMVETTLHVGLGTFQPVHVEPIEDHKLHSERYRITQEAAQKINRALEAGRRIVAVGTTTVRTLEFCAAQTADGRMRAGEAEADLFIYPGFKFRATGALLTNFHLPKSTLLMLVCAFAGRETLLHAYEHAIGQRYRFYSYGDCMLIE